MAPAGKGRPFVRHDTAADRATDLGRRASQKPARVVVLLRYNHQAEFARLLANLERSPHPHYVTREAFLRRYAPTAEQERRVLASLTAAGFTIAHRYPNRTLIDVQAPAATVERFFSTEIHDFRQRGGIRVANVRPLRVPQSLQSFVADADANSVVSMRTALSPDDVTFASPDASTNLVKNPRFTTGKLEPWTACVSSGRVTPPAISSVHPHSPKFDAFVVATRTPQTHAIGLQVGRLTSKMAS